MPSTQVVEPEVRIKLFANVQVVVRRRACRSHQITECIICVRVGDRARRTSQESDGAVTVVAVERRHPVTFDQLRLAD